MRFFRPRGARGSVLGPPLFVSTNKFRLLAKMPVAKSQIASAYLDGFSKFKKRNNLKEFPYRTVWDEFLIYKLNYRKKPTEHWETGYLKTESETANSSQKESEVNEILGRP